VVSRGKSASSKVMLACGGFLVQGGFANCFDTVGSVLDVVVRCFSLST